MNANVNVKRKFKVNGKEYNSIEEMPPDIRNAFEKAMASQAGSGQQANPATMQTKIIFNGIEYKSVDAMPQDVRQLYEKLLKSGETGTAPTNIITASDKSGMQAGPKTYGNTNMGNMGKPTKIEPSAFSPRMLIIGVMVIALIILLYFVFHGR
jgi:Tfp pilus assembly protein PilW